MVYGLVRGVFFRLDAEQAHDISKSLMISAKTIIPPMAIQDPRLKQELFGRTFRNPVGLAAGFDKEAELVEVMDRFGVGFAEVGTITPKAQVGNPRPRVFRFPKYESLQNAMGFNNLGQEVAFENLKRFPFNIPVGVNGGKNKITPNENAIDDYASIMSRFSERSDFIVANVSSPNTPNIRDLQTEDFIKELFGRAKELTKRPVLLKIAPDMSPEQAVTISRAAVENGAGGIIATNTTTDYSLLPGAKDFGGISGRVLGEKSFRIFEAIAKELHDQTTLIAVGGIDSGAEAYRRIRSGASLVELYTALVYKGPMVFRAINKELLALLERDGLKNISEAVGSRWS